MQFGKYQQRMDYLLELIRKEHTGAPKQLSSRLGISKRMLYRYMEELAAQHGEIEFCCKKNLTNFAR